MIRIERFLEESNIARTFDTCLNPAKEQYTLDLQSLLVCLAHWHLGNSLEICPIIYGSYFMSKVVVFSKSVDFPIFFDEGHLTAAVINMPFLLHMINFWVRRGYYEAFNSVEMEDDVKGWKQPISDVKKGVRGLSRHWKGSYGKRMPRFIAEGFHMIMGVVAYAPNLSKLEQLRTHLAESHRATLQETLELESFDECGIEDIEFHFGKDRTAVAWPKAFEEHLNALPSPSLCAHNRSLALPSRKVKHRPAAKPDEYSQTPVGATEKTSEPDYLTNLSGPSRTRKTIIESSRSTSKTLSPAPCIPSPGIDYLAFGGIVESEPPFLSDDGMTGIIHNLPKQAGIPGFQRISFMKYALNIPSIENEQSVVGPGDHYDHIDDSTYCYQGVVLPGGHIIFGRWWSPIDDAEQLCSGPFMLWAVDK